MAVFFCGTAMRFRENNSWLVLGKHNMSRIEYCCCSYIGNYNSINEDGFVCDGRIREDEEVLFSGLVEQDISVWGVFDGIGSLKGSHKASRIASETFRDSDYDEYTGFKLSNTLCLANKTIFENYLESRERIGTTASVVVVKKDRLFFTSIGDSRIYKVTDKEIVQLTSDDSVVDNGKNVLTKALGTTISICPEVSSEEIDCKYYIICTDGLYKCVSDKRMKEIINSGCSLENMARTIMDDVSKQSHIDNVTFIIVNLSI